MLEQNRDVGRREGNAARGEGGGPTEPTDARPSGTHDPEPPRSTRTADTEAASVRHPPAPIARAPWRWVTIAALLIVAIAGAWWFYGRGQTAQQKPAAAGDGPGVPVEVAAAERSALPIYLDGLGTAQAFNTVLVRSRVDGELQEIAFQEGQMVNEGDVLARIDPRPYQAALDQAVAKKQQSEATRASNETDLSRTQELASRGFAPRQQLDQRTATVGAIEAQIGIDQAQIDTARLQLGYTTIRAPITGRTGLRLTDKGNIVRASDQTGIVEIAQIEPIAVVLTAPEQQLPDIAAAHRAGPVEVIALRSDGKAELSRGTLSLINNEVDQASGTVRLKATFPNTEDRLWPGLSVNTRLLVRTLPDVVTVPDDAVQRGPNELFVFVVKDGTAERRKVKLGVFAGNRVVVQEGVSAGEQVVVAGQSRLRDKTKVDTGGEKRDGGGQDAAAKPPANEAR